MLHNFTDKNPKQSSRKLLEIRNEFNKFQGTKSI